MSQFGVDYDAAMAGATLQWRGLSPAMKRALFQAGLCSDGEDRALLSTTPTPTGDALWRRGLATLPTFGVRRWLTQMGLLVRLAGIAESKRIEALATEV